MEAVDPHALQSPIRQSSGLSARQIAPGATTNITPRWRWICMSRITIPAHSEVPSDSRPLLDEVTSQLGFTPNLHRLMSISPAVLSGFICLQRSLGKTLDRSTR